MKITKFVNIIISAIFIFNVDYVSSEDDLIPLQELYKQQNLKSEIGKLKYLSNFSLQCTPSVILGKNPNKVPKYI